MNISTLNLLSKDASKNLRNNATTSIASIASINVNVIYFRTICAIHVES